MNINKRDVPNKRDGRKLLIVKYKHLAKIQEKLKV